MPDSASPREGATRGDPSTDAAPDPCFELLRTETVVLLERLMDPRVVGQVLDVVVGNDLRRTLPPQHCAAHFADFGEATLEMLADAFERHAGVDEVIGQQHPAAEGASADGDVLRDVE